MSLKITCVICTGTDDDLEFYVRKCGDILGVMGKLDKEKRDAKHVLEHIFFQVVEFKKLNQVCSILAKYFSLLTMAFFLKNENAFDMSVSAFSFSRSTILTQHRRGFLHTEAGSSGTTEGRGLNSIMCGNVTG